MDGNVLANLATPVVGTDAATKDYVDSVAGGFTQTRYRSDNTDITTNINTQTTLGIQYVPLLGNETKTNADFTKLDDSTLRFNFTGRVRVAWNIHYFTSGARVALQAQNYINNSLVGARVSTGYVRSANGHQEASLHCVEEFDVVTNDTLRVTIRRESSVGTLARLTSVGTSSFIVVKVE